jgi:hypothetical protein
MEDESPRRRAAGYLQMHGTPQAAGNQPLVRLRRIERLKTGIEEEGVQYQNVRMHGKFVLSRKCALNKPGRGFENVEGFSR